MRRHLVVGLACALVVLVVGDASARCGVERWPVKTGTDADAHLVNPNAVVSTSIEDLAELARPNTLPQDERVQPVETTVFEVTATLVAYKWENNPRSGDNDYHLVLEDDDGRTLIAEIPNPVCVDDASPFHDAIHDARDAFDHEFTATGSFRTANAPSSFARRLN